MSKPIATIWLTLIMSAIVSMDAGAGGISGKAWTKGVGSDVEAWGVGNVTKDPKSVSSLVSASSSQNDTIPGWAVCANKGGNKPPGLNLADLSGSFGGFGQLNKQDVDKNGKATKTIVAIPSETQLATLISACPNTTNYEVIDFIPEGPFLITYQLTDETTEEPLEAITYECELLGGPPEFDSRTKLPEKKLYSCDPI